MKTMNRTNIFKELKLEGCLDGVEYVSTVVKNSIYKARYEDSVVIVKIINYDNVKWAEMDSFWEKYGDDPKKFYDRIIYNYSRLFDIGLGPILYKYEVCGDYLILVMEYIKYKIEPGLDQSIYNDIQTAIDKMHKAGIIHGDLHAGNMGLTENMEPKFIDLETVFYLDDVDEIAQDWMMHGFEIDSLDEFIDDEKKNWAYDIFG